MIVQMIEVQIRLHATLGSVADLENQKRGFQRNMTSELNAYSAIIKDS
jgi:hypothetical protein